MLVLSEEQIGKLSKIREEQFYRSLHDNVVKFTLATEPLLPKSAVENRLDAARKKAHKYGMVTEQELTVFFYMMAAVPVDFEIDQEWQWLLPILEAEGSGEERLDQLTLFLDSEGA